MLKLSLAAALAAGLSAFAAVSPANAVITYSCGPVISSKVVTGSFANFTTNSTSLVNVTGSQVKIDIPAGKTRCVKVKFSAISKCGTTGANDICVLLAVDKSGSVAFDPANLGIEYNDESANYRAGSFEWAKRLGEGTHAIVMKAGVQNSSTAFNIMSWTMDVEVSQ